MKDKKTKLEQYYIDKMKNKNGGRLPDEREMQENTMALNTACVFGLIFDGAMILYYFITRNIEKSYPYLAQLLVIAVVFALMSFASKTVKPPHTLWGKDVDYSQGRKAFARRAGLCIIESLVYAAVLIALDIYADKKVTGSIFCDAVITAVIFSAINITVCEHRVRSYRRYQARLDAEEEDDDIE